MVVNGIKTQDKITIVTGDDKIVCETYNPQSLLHRIKKLLGFKCYAEDLILDSGLADIVSMVQSRYDYISIGTSTVPPSHVQTQLLTETMRVQCSSKVISTTFYPNDTVTFTSLFTPSYQMVITESGVHKNQSTTNDVTLSRETFTAFTATANVQFTINWQIIMMR